MSIETSLPTSPSPLYAIAYVVPETWIISGVFPLTESYSSESMMESAIGPVEDISNVTKNPSSPSPAYATA